MASGAPLHLLRPTSLLLNLGRKVFDRIPVDGAWVDAVRAAGARGPVVHVLRNVSLVDLLTLDALTTRFGLPRIAFANDLGGWLDARQLLARAPDARLREAMRSGKAALLFLKRPPARVGPAHRGRRGGDAPLRALIDLARRDGLDITLVPHTLLWAQRAERLGFSVVDTVFGPAEFPGDVRAAAQLLLNYRHCALRAGEAVRLRAFLEEQAPEGGSGAPDDETLARRLTYALLRKVERERRAMVGPAQKPLDRVREEVLRSPKLQALLRDLAGPGDKERAELEAKARQMLRKLQASPDPGTLKGLEIAAETLVERVYAGVDVDREGIERVREAARRGSLVFLPSHKSHVDYLLLSFVLRKHALQLPVVAAGDNLAFFPLGPLFRRAGAFFIRRSFRGDRLYAAVVDAYVRRLLRDGWAIELFLEGGRSRTGKLLTPKLGLLNMIVEAALGVEGHEISFVPVSIGYERMMEEGAYAAELSGEEKRREDAAALLGLRDVLREKYGRVNVQFGQILTLREMRDAAGIGHPAGAGRHDIAPARRRALVTRLAHRVMSEINRVTAVTPGSLVATVLLCHRRRGLPHVALLAQCARLTALVRRLGARTTPSLTRGDGEMREGAIREAALLYVRGGLVRQHMPGDTLTGKARKRAKIYTGDDVIYTVPDDKRLLLDLSRNIIIHLFVDRALVSAALLALPDGEADVGAAAPSGRARAGIPRRVALGALREQVRSLSRLFKLEFVFRADAPFERIFQEAIDDMVALGELSIDGDAVAPGAGWGGLDGPGWVGFYAALLRSFLEGYRVAARAARVLLDGPMAEPDLVKRALRIGEQMFLGGEIERSEAVSRPVVENALAAYVEQGYLRREAGKLALAPSFASEGAAQAIEARIAGHLAPGPGGAAW